MSRSVNKKMKKRGLSSTLIHMDFFILASHPIGLVPLPDRLHQRMQLYGAVDILDRVIRRELEKLQEVCVGGLSTIYVR